MFFSCDKIKEVEKQIYEEVKSSNPEIIDSINNTGKLEEEIEKNLKVLILIDIELRYQNHLKIFLLKL